MFGDEALEFSDGHDSGDGGCHRFFGDPLAHEGSGGDAEGCGLVADSVDQVLG